MPRSTISLIRTLLMATFVFGAAGTLIELFLLAHTDGWEQWIPNVLLAGGLVVAAWCVASRRPIPLKVFRATMVTFVVAGLVGTALHFKGNVEWERESDPSIAGRELIWSALTGATPSLAPGTMIQLGLIGLLFTLRHPILTNSPEDQ
jgi:hypothetical protein